MSSSDVPYQLNVYRSHIEVTMNPPIAEGTWSEIEKLGDEVTQETQQRKSPNCLVDLSSLNYMGSSLVALLVRIWKDVKRSNGEMVVVARHPLVRETISLAGLDKIWTIYSEHDGACEAIGAPLKSGEKTHSKFRERGIAIGIVLLVVLVLSVAIFAINQQT